MLHAHVHVVGRLPSIWGATGLLTDLAVQASRALLCLTHTYGTHTHVRPTPCTFPDHSRPRSRAPAQHRAQLQLRQSTDSQYTRVPYSTQSQSREYRQSGTVHPHRLGSCRGAWTMVLARSLSGSHGRECRRVALSRVDPYIYSCVTVRDTHTGLGYGCSVLTGLSGIALQWPVRTPAYCYSELATLKTQSTVNTIT